MASAATRRVAVGPAPAQAGVPALGYPPGQAVRAPKTSCRGLKRAMSSVRAPKTSWRGLKRAMPWLLLLVSAGIAAACPACEVGIGDETVKTTLAGYVYSYVWLGLCPFFVVGSVGFSLYRALVADGPPQR